MENLIKRRERALKIIAKLEEVYPNVRCELTHADAYQLLVATILSAQCTDVRVNMVTPELFRHFPDINSMAEAEQDKVIDYIHSTGFYKNKSKNIIACCRKLRDEFYSRVPDNITDLVSLPGVGRKTANVILNHIYHVPAIVVDTHVGRLSRHLGLTEENDPAKVEAELMTVLPKENWIAWNHQLIHHGRSVCISRRPRCGECFLRDLCPGPIQKEKTRTHS